MLKKLLLIFVSCGSLFVLQAVAVAQQESKPQMSERDAQNEYRAVIISRDRAVLAAEMAGRIVKMPFSVGDSFKKNDVLVSFDCRLIEFNQTKASRDEEGARRKWEAASELAKVNSTGRLNVDLAYIDYRKAEAENNGAKTLVDRCYIKAPFDGRVIRHAVQTFENVTVGQPVIEVVGSQVIEVESAVPSAVALNVKPGEKFTFKSDQGDMSLKGQVVGIAPVIDPVSQLVSLRGIIDEKDTPVVIGITGSIQLGSKK